VTHSPYARAPDLSVTLSRIAVQYFTLIFHQHTEAKDVITSKCVGIATRYEVDSLGILFFTKHSVYVSSHIQIQIVIYVIGTAWFEGVGT
jgi:hypothetical protein